jgi:hypothetical protein
VQSYCFLFVYNIDCGTVSSAWLERHVDIVEVAGSSPAPSTALSSLFILNK